MCDHPIETPCECETGPWQSLLGASLTILALRDRLARFRISHATLHSELVQLRVAYAEIEAERNRLREQQNLREQRSLRNQERLAHMTPEQKARAESELDVFTGKRVTDNDRD